jgi:hypothetical protein
MAKMEGHHHNNLGMAINSMIEGQLLLRDALLHILWIDAFIY